VDICTSIKKEHSFFVIHPFSFRKREEIAHNRGKGRNIAEFVAQKSFRKRNCDPYHVGEEGSHREKKVSESAYRVEKRLPLASVGKENGTPHLDLLQERKSVE